MCDKVAIMYDLLSLYERKYKNDVITEYEAINDMILFGRNLNFLKTKYSRKIIVNMNHFRCHC